MVLAQDLSGSAADPSQAGAIAVQPGQQPATAILPIGTPVVFMLNQELSTQTADVGDRFDVTLLKDVVHTGTVVIPKGTLGKGEVTFVGGKGGFGKAGMLLIALRSLALGDRRVALKGLFREEGKNKNGAAAATWFAVGIFAGTVQGKPGLIPKGRELHGKTAEDIVFSPESTPPLAPERSASAEDPALPPPGPSAPVASAAAPPTL